jgi:VWFA-related protein
LPGTAQDAPTPEATEAFSEQIAVNVVNVEVYVQDKDGTPITDLTRDDFAVTEDGRPVELVNFYRVVDGRPLPELEAPYGTEPLAVGAPALESIPQGPTVLTVPETQRLHLIVYVDNFNIHPLNRNRAFDRLRLFLRDTLQPGDEVMVASYDRSLHIRHPFTGSADSVNRVLLELEDMSGMAVEREAERADAIQEIYDTDSLHEALWAAKQFADNQNHELAGTLDALTEMVDSLAGLPGRKMLLHVSDGLPMVPGQDLYQAIQQRFADISTLAEAQSRDNSRRFMSIIAKANSNRISFYTIDTSGLQTRAMGAETRAVSSPVVVGAAVASVRARNLQDTLLLMADRTGGRAVVNTNDVAAGLELIRSDFSNYYSLGYRAPARDRGQYHRIEVRLKNPVRGWKIRHREGYRDKSLEAEISDGLRAFLVHNYQTNPLGVTLEVGQEAEPDANGYISVAIQVRVPIASIVLLPRPDFYEGRLRLYFGALDEEGRDAPPQQLPFELRIPHSSLEMAQKDQMVRVINATMRPGSHKLVVAVRDEIGEERSFVGRWLKVGS